VKTLIRREVESDYREVEELTREAFWNLHVPGCAEHYLVHKMRAHPDFLAELDFVAILGDRIVGNIMYARSYLVDESNRRIETVTFGPISVLPEYQRQGIGSSLIQHSKQLVLEKGYKAIIIYGHPQNYCKHGFKGSMDYNISNAEGKFPYSLLVLELEKGFLEGRKWQYLESDIYNIDEIAAEEYDQLFEPKKKEYRYTQEEFHIACRAYVE
jgi:putative acetyltransferase